MNFFLDKINEYGSAGRFTFDIRKRFFRRFYLGEIDEDDDGKEFMIWEPVEHINHEIRSWANDAVYYATRGNEEGTKLTHVLLSLANQNIETLKEAILKVAKELDADIIAEEYRRAENSYVRDREADILACFKKNKPARFWYGKTPGKIGDNPNHFHFSVRDVDYKDNQCVLHPDYFDYDAFKKLGLHHDCLDYGVFVISQLSKTWA